MGELEFQIEKFNVCGLKGKEVLIVKELKLYFFREQIFLDLCVFFMIELVIVKVFFGL